MVLANAGINPRVVGRMGESLDSPTALEFSEIYLPNLLVKRNSAQTKRGILKIWLEANKWSRCRRGLTGELRASRPAGATRDKQARNKRKRD